MDTNKLTLSVSEVAKLLGIHRNSLYAAIKRGEFPHIKIGKRVLIVKAQLEKILEGKKE